mmetsp:Transcript_2811/g.11059  ORF Transcript_2811/g.11059 Transcript_2811/m.11059 type:complete len:247 (+) Transcript_2811:227-967(+)
MPPRVRRRDDVRVLRQDVPHDRRQRPRPLPRRRRRQRRVHGPTVAKIRDDALPIRSRRDRLRKRMEAELRVGGVPGRVHGVGTRDGVRQGRGSRRRRRRPPGRVVRQRVVHPAIRGERRVCARGRFRLLGVHDETNRGVLRRRRRHRFRGQGRRPVVRQGGRGAAAVRDGERRRGSRGRGDALLAEPIRRGCRDCEGARAGGRVRGEHVHGPDCGARGRVRRWGGGGGGAPRRGFREQRRRHRRRV